MAPSVPTKCLILSDTHGAKLQHNPTERADVVLHCGDVTEESKLDKSQTTIDLLRNLNAPLKLVIPGNHDWTLDTPIFAKKIAEMKPSPADLILVEHAYGRFGDARKLFDDARGDDIFLLDEGIHHFKLANGASLTVYAGPFTQSTNDWGFQYHPNDDHIWALDGTVDVVMTHSPPRGVLDLTASKQRAGSASLFAAGAKSRPQLHCFGHVHESWGARRLTWRDESEMEGSLSHFTAIDNAESTTIETKAKLRPHHLDDTLEMEEKERRRRGCDDRGFGDAGMAAVRGEQTLFVNAAMKGEEGGQQYWAWLARLDLPASSSNALD